MSNLKTRLAALEAIRAKASERRTFIIARALSNDGNSYLNTNGEWTPKPSGDGVTVILVTTVTRD